MVTTARNRRGATNRSKSIRYHLRQSVKFVRPWPVTTLLRWRCEGRIFCVRWRNRDLYPAFQFGPCDLPWHGVRGILRVVPKDARGWPLLSWFEARNVLLDTRKPSRVLKTQPDRVLLAAERFYARED